MSLPPIFQGEASIDFAESDDSIFDLLATSSDTGNEPSRENVDLGDCATFCVAQMYASSDHRWNKKCHLY